MTDSQLRVWHLSSNRWYSAITEYALCCAKSLQMQGCQSLYSPLLGTPGAVRALEYGINTRPVRSFRPTSWRQITQIGQDFRPDVIVTYGGVETSMLQILRPLFRSAKVMRFRGQEIDTDSFVSRIKLKASFVGVSGILAPSELIKRQLADIKADADITHIPLGRDINRFTPRKLDRIDSQHPRPEIVILGRLDPIKGHQRAMRIFQIARKHWPEHTPAPILHVIGKPENISVRDLMSFAKQAGMQVEDDLKITTDLLQDVASSMSRSAVGFVSSMGSEIICRVAEEFLLCGTRIFVSGAGSLNEMVFPSAGISYDGFDDEAAGILLARECLESLSETYEQRQLRADQARRLYSLEMMGQSLLSVMRQLTV